MKLMGRVIDKNEINGLNKNVGMKEKEEATGFYISQQLIWKRIGTENGKFCN